MEDQTIRLASGRTVGFADYGIADVVLAAVRPLVRDEPLDRGGDGLGHASTCSPSPSATGRSGSMATLA